MHEKLNLGLMGFLIAALSACSSDTGAGRGQHTGQLGGSESPDGVEPGGSASDPDGTDPDAPVSDDPGAGDGNQASPQPPTGPNCDAGFIPKNEADGARCRSTYRGTCFESDEAACACAGCALGDCRIAESYPTQVFCDEKPAACRGGFVRDAPGETRTCNLTTEGLCFEASEDACLCHCGVETCIVLESFPAQVACH